MPRLFRQFHTVVDGGMGRNAIEEEKLEGAEAKSNQHFLIELCVWALQQGLDLPIEPNLPTQHAEHQRCSKVSIRWRKLIDSFPAQQVVAVRLSAFDG